MERKEEKGENGRQTSVIGYIDFPGIGSSSNWPPMYDIGLATRLFLYAMAIVKFVVMYQSTRQWHAGP